ncbi:Hypothetical protein BN69_2855 [Methylocystis sp. SC2]|nr:Hypothetical protein BN69_2855 [Methylocystis sp. SC2]
MLRWFHDGKQTYDIFSDFSQFLFRAAKLILRRGVRLSAGGPGGGARGAGPPRCAARKQRLIVAPLLMRRNPLTSSLRRC